VKLEPGLSNRVAVFNRRLMAFKILDIATGHVIKDINFL
jgi:hypothetical protein